MKYFIKAAALTVLFLMASGCAINKPVEKQQYLLHIANPKLMLTATTKCKDPISIIATSANTPFEQQNFLYRVSDSRYLIDYYRGFLSSPAQQLDTLLTKYFHSTKKTGPATQKKLETKADKADKDADKKKDEKKIELHVRILELYADYRDRNHPQAIIALNVNLTRQTTATDDPEKSPTVMLSDKTLRVAVPLEAKSTESLLVAWGKGLEILFKQIDRIILAQ